MSAEEFLEIYKVSRKKYLESVIPEVRAKLREYETEYLELYGKPFEAEA